MNDFKIKKNVNSMKQKNSFFLPNFPLSKFFIHFTEK